MEITSKGIKILAPAKVNLFLEILWKRDDGYHEIRSLIQPIRLFDTLWIKESPKGLEIRCPGHPELENQTNLVVRTIHLMEKELDRTLSFLIRLEKKIPIGAGLGGGSSDAAAVLSGINQWLGHPIQPDRLPAIAAQIGSDVPFFLSKGTALASGRGERLELWPTFPAWWYVLIYPGFSILTSWAYNQIKFPLTRGEKTIIINRLKAMGGNPEKDQFKNDLEGVVQPFFPILGKIKKAFLEQGCFQTLMSGSGSTVFGIWMTQKPAQKAYRLLKEQGWGEVFIARGL